MLEPVRVANYLSPAPLFAHMFHTFDGHSPEGGTVTASNGMSIACTPVPDRLDRNDIVLVFGSWGAEHYQNPRMISWLRLQARLGARICGVEIGAFVLARCGLLNRRRATTHWSYISGFQEKFQDIEAVEEIFTHTDRMLTCAGGTAGIDLMLHLIGVDHGARLAGEVANQILHHPIRPADTAQRARGGQQADALSAPVRMAIDLIGQNMSEPLSVPELCDLVGRSQRQLERQFSKEMGCSIVQFGALMRLQHARVLLISTGLGVREVAAASGFNSLSHFGFAFKKCFGKRPRDYREAWSDNEADPQWPGSLAQFLDTIEAKRRVALQSAGQIT